MEHAEKTVFTSPPSARGCFVTAAVCILFLPILMAIERTADLEVQSAWFVASGIAVVASVCLALILSVVVQELRLDPVNRTYVFRFTKLSTPLEGKFDEFERLDVEWHHGIRPEGVYVLYLHWKESAHGAVSLGSFADAKSANGEAQRIRTMLGLPTSDASVGSTAKH